MVSKELLDCHVSTSFFAAVHYLKDAHGDRHAFVGSATQDASPRVLCPEYILFY